VRALRALGHEVDVLSPPGIDPFALTDAAPVDKSDAKVGGLQRLWKLISRHLPNALFELLEIGYNVPAYFRLRRTLRSKSYDLVYERYAFYLVTGALLAKRFGAQLVLEANEVVGIKDRARAQSFPALGGAFEAFLLRRAARVIVVSSRLRDMAIARGAEPHKVVVVPNAINVEEVRNRQRNHELQAELGLDGFQVVGFAGWFDRWDRLDFFIDVFAEGGKPTRGRDCCWSATARGCLRRRRAALPGLRLSQADGRGGAAAFERIRLADHPVRVHGARLTSGRARVPPVEDVLEDERTGLLFRPLDRTGCAAAIRRLLDSAELRGRVGENVVDAVRSRHTWARNAERIVACTAARSA
jgi:glycosyltransferase involved in cell wall biosynthesis